MKRKFSQFKFALIFSPVVLTLASIGALPVLSQVQNAADTIGAQERMINNVSQKDAAEKRLKDEADLETNKVMLADLVGIGGLLLADYEFLKPRSRANPLEKHIRELTEKGHDRNFILKKYAQFADSEEFLQALDRYRKIVLKLQKIDDEFEALSPGPNFQAQAEKIDRKALTLFLPLENAKIVLTQAIGKKNRF